MTEPRKTSARKTHPVRVVLADDNEQLLEILCDGLKEEAGITVVAKAATGVEALDAVARTDPDVAILDVRMPDMDGLEAARKLASQYPQLGLILHTSSTDKTVMDAARRAGVRGFVRKGESLGILVEAIDLVTAGGTMGVSEAMDTRLPGDSDLKRAALGWLRDLSVREPRE